MSEMKVTFESRLDELENIVSRLEGGKLGLDESLELFEKGTALVKECTAAISEAEQKVSLIRQSLSGEVSEECFDGERD